MLGAALLGALVAGPAFARGLHFALGIGGAAFPLAALLTLFTVRRPEPR